MTRRPPHAEGDDTTTLIVAAFWLFVAIVGAVFVLGSVIGRAVTG